MVQSNWVPRRGPEVHVGEDWAYRARAVDEITPVRIIKVGVRQPPRIFIRFLDESYEGREEWVPPGRLQVAWADVGSWQARQDRWERVAVPSEGVYDTPEYWAASTVFDVAVPEEILRMAYRGPPGVVCVSDLDKAAELLGVHPSAFVEDSRAFLDDDGTTVVPWTTTLTLAKSSAPKHIDKILGRVERDERRNRQRAIYGEYDKGRKNSWYTPPEICAELNAEWEPVHRLLREWCGWDTVEDRNEIRNLRAEVLRIAQVAQRAITALEQAGGSKAAKSLKQELGVSVESIRASERTSH